MLVRRVTLWRFGLLVLVLLSCSRSAIAQQQPPGAPPPGLPSAAQQTAPQPAPPETMLGDRHEATNSQKDHHYIGHFEYQRGDTSIYADDAWFYTDEHKLLLNGHVTMSQGPNRISAEKADFNTETRIGTFSNASGIASVRQQRRPSRPGELSLPPVAGQETVVYFFGDTVEKIGPKKYKITNGGFTTCVQPTPRWDLHADTVILNVDHYTFLKQAIFTVKGVPMLYVPLLIYPTKSEDRATGFLLPTYGSSSLRGQSIHDAFFWAINRSQDATVSHDWFSKVGQGVGTEYRYNYGPIADGNLWGHFLDEHEATYVDSTGNATTLPASRSYEVRGGGNQLLPGNIHMRANVNYFSSIVSSQTFNTNIYDASRNQRSYGVNAVGAWSGFTMNATADRQEYFYDVNNSVISGDGPRIDLSRNERPLFGSQVYFGLTSEYADLIRSSRSFDSTTSLTTENNLGVARFDIWPQIRYPLKQWQWFTVNSTVGWRDTYYTRSAIIDPDTGQQRTDKTSDEAISRRYFSLQSQIVGPVFNRIWDTPDNGYAEKFKHSIEPYLTVMKTSSIDNFNEIIHTDAVDSIAGGTNLTYGVVNRFFAKRRTTPGLPAQSREILDVELSQSYYTNQLQAQYDLQYQSSQLGGGAPSHFSAYALGVRAMPTNEFNATMRAEFDPRYHTMKTLSVNGSYSWTGLMQESVGWTKYGCVVQITPDCSNLTHFINVSTNAHTRDNKYGSVYTFNYDIAHGGFVQQQITGFYNAQCCGLAFQYQSYNYPTNVGIPIPADHRFFLSFTLAGLGNFSPFNGALSGVPR